MTNLNPLIADEPATNSTLTTVGVGAGGVIVTIVSSFAVFLRELSNQRATFKHALIKQVTMQRKSNQKLGQIYQTSTSEMHKENMEQGKTIIQVLQGFGDKIEKLANSKQNIILPVMTPEHKPDGS